METKNNLNSEKSMKSFSKGICRAVRILRGFAIAGVIVCGIFAALVLILGEKMVVPGTMGDVDLGAISLKLSEQGSPAFAQIKPVILLELGFGMLTSGLLWFVFSELLKITVDAREGRPFSGNVPSSLRKLGIAAMVYGLLKTVLERILMDQTVSAYRIASLWKPELVKSTDVGSPLNILPFVFIGLLLFFFSYVFRYGMKLQQESDETL